MLWERKSREVFSFNLPFWIFAHGSQPAMFTEALKPVPCSPPDLNLCSLWLWWFTHCHVEAFAFPIPFFNFGWITGFFFLNEEFSLHHLGEMSHWEFSCFHFFFNSFISPFCVYIYFFYFTILYWFCHTSTWIHHGCTSVPPPESLSHLPPRTIPLGHPSAPAPSILYHASNLDWRLVSHMILYMFQCHSPKSSHRALTESKRLFYTSVILLLSRIQGCCYHLSKFHIYVLVYCIGVFLSGLHHSV